MRRALALLSCIAAAPATALAAAAPLPATDPIGPGSVLQLTLSLAAVVAAIFGLGWILRRLHGLPGSTHRALRVVATLPVGTRERIAIIQAGDTQVLVGLSPGRIQALHVLDRPVGATATTVAADTAAIGPIASESPPASNFRKLFERERTRCDS